MKIFFNNIYSTKFSRNFVFDLIRVNMAIAVQVSDVAPVHLVKILVTI